MGGGIGGLLYSLRGGQAKFNLSNGRGDIVAQSDAGAQVTWTASYEAFGKRPVETGTNLDRQRANTKEEDPTGLLHEHFRYRDLETGVWLSRDPAGFVDGPNLYAYVRQNPWTFWDPRGLSGKKIKDAIKAPERAKKALDSINKNKDVVNGKKVRTPEGYGPGDTVTFKSDTEMGKKYQNGVKIDDKGYPDFSPYASESVDLPAMKGTPADFIEANKLAGLKETPEGFTWHHHQNRKTMQLVPSDVHSIAHTGGAATTRGLGESAKSAALATGAVTAAVLMPNTLEARTNGTSVMDGLVQDVAEATVMAPMATAAAIAGGIDAAGEALGENAGKIRDNKGTSLLDVFDFRNIGKIFGGPR